MENGLMRASSSWSKSLSSQESRPKSGNADDFYRASRRAGFGPKQGWALSVILTKRTRTRLLPKPQLRSPLIVGLNGEGKIKSADQYSGPAACEYLHIVLEHKKYALRLPKNSVMARVGNANSAIGFPKFLALKFTLLYLASGLLKPKESCGLPVVGNWVARDIGSEGLK
ncbi:hypothetical protein B9Z19DRAFT_1064640 [Tuber borchii]|uniref:Uncharacterized protein n=1 Tax=Tuber borchii TaxID=42251 RepID=A0A2T6ZTX8_TUBBO|nr:hypothetical protein B9Z19DRAFT_1064640 [Tuber borchii]